MQKTSERAFGLVLVLVGLFVVFVGLNVGLGGILTLGWQGQVPFFTVTQPHIFLVQDSHTRFFGGMFGTAGVFLLLASGNVQRAAPVLYFIFAALFVGGLSRFSQLRADVVLGPDLLGSVLAELVLMPVLMWWLGRLTRHADFGQKAHGSSDPTRAD